MTKALLDKVMALSGPEKLELIDKLWDSFEPEDEGLEVSKEEKQLLDERWERYLANPGSAMSLKELKVAVAKRMK